MPSTLLEQCVHEKLKSLPEETAGQVGYSSANLWKNVPQTGISKCHILSCSFVTKWIFFEVAVLLPLLNSCILQSELCSFPP